MVRPRVVAYAFRENECQSVSQYVVGSRSVDNKSILSH